MLETIKYWWKKLKTLVNKWKDIPSSWIGILHIVKMFIQPQKVYIFNAIHTKTLMAFFYINFKNNPSIQITKSTDDKSKSRQLGFYQTEMLLHNKGNHQQDEKKRQTM